MPKELTLAEKVALISDVSSEIIVGILRRRAQKAGMDMGTLLATATANSQEADQILDELEEKGHENDEVIAGDDDEPHHEEQGN